MDTLLQIVVIIILTLFEAVFVAAEIALVTMRRSRIDQLVDEGNRSAQRVKGLVAQPGRFLAVTQIGLTFLGFLASAYAAVNLTTSLEQLLAGSGLPVLASSAGALALIIVTLILSLFTILFGELIPKSLALAHTEAFALRLSAFIVLMLRILGPIVYVLTAVTNGVANMLGAGSQSQDTMSTEELKILVERGGQQGILEAEEEQMIHAVIELGDQRIHEVMVPRIAMVTLPVTASMEQAIDVVIEQGHSRIPVYEQSIDEIVGILYAKDLLPFLKASVGSRPNLRSILRTPVFVPESMSVDDLLHEFQRRKVHIAIVLDEYGGTAGLATIEDLLEEIVGEIQDEYDAEEPLIVRLDDDQARIDGRADIDDLADLFGTDLGLDDADEYDTVGGLIYHRLGTVPRPGDQVSMDGLTLTVETTDGRRVGKVLAVREREHDRPDDDEADRQAISSLGSGADDRDDDLLESCAGLGADDARGVQLGKRLVAVTACLVPRVVPGAGPLEDGGHLGHLGRGQVVVRIERPEALTILGTGMLVCVEDGQRLLAMDDVRRDLAGRPLGAPDA